MAFKIIVGDDSVLKQRETREPGPGRSAIIGYESNMRGNERRSFAKVEDGQCVTPKGRAGRFGPEPVSLSRVSGRGPCPSGLRRPAYHVGDRVPSPILPPSILSMLDL